MFEHRDIWNAIDQLASRFDLSPSALAKLAGLDATTFNKSKRITPSGRLRWPSTESLSKVLRALNVEFYDFAQIVNNESMHAAALKLPLISWSLASTETAFDHAGFLKSDHGHKVSLPAIVDVASYLVEISDNSMAPALQRGDRLLVAPNEKVGQGDCVIVKTLRRTIMVRNVSRMTDTLIELASLNTHKTDQIFDRFEVLWMARIVWISQ